jgi:hypothetical protein
MRDRTALVSIATASPPLVLLQRDVAASARGPFGDRFPAAAIARFSECRHCATAARKALAIEQRSCPSARKPIGRDLAIYLLLRPALRSVALD